MGENKTYIALEVKVQEIDTIKSLKG